MNILKKLRLAGMYAILDSSDNSVTVSKKLFRRMDVVGKDKAAVYVFKVGDDYAFTVNPPLENTQLNEVQYNQKYKCIGFETLCPTVNRIFYDYGIKAGKCKMTVIPEDIKGTKIFRFAR